MAYSYNVDYWDGKSQLLLAPEMLQLRYVNYPKDYFMGMLPSSQYGSVAVLPSSYDTGGAVSNRIVTAPLSSPLRVADGSSSSVRLSQTVSSSQGIRLNTDLSALSLRATEYLQRWNEVVQFSSKDYTDQMAAQSR